MRDLAEELDRLLRVSVLQLSLRRTHPAHRLDRAVVALRRPGALLVPGLEEKGLPALAEAALADAEGLLRREYADSDVPVGIDGERVDPAAAVIHLVAVHPRPDRLREVLRELPPALDAPRVAEIELHDLLGGEANGER